MDFVLSDDQLALREGIRALLEGRFSSESVRALANAPGALDVARWRELAEAGVFSLRLPEDEGGLGLGVADAAVVYEELGAALVPGPLVWSELGAGCVAGAADGSTVVGGIDLTAGPDVVFSNFDACERLLVLSGDGVRNVAAADVAARPLERPLDPLTPVHVADALPAGEPIGDSELATGLRRVGTVLTAALALGVARAATELGVAYAKERRQFDRVIGSFQAVKHLLADAAVRAELARAAVHSAALHVDDPGLGDVERAVAGAKHLAGRAAVANSHTCVQVHGGMGYTWEADPHLLLKRAWVLETMFGGAAAHAATLAVRLSG